MADTWFTSDFHLGHFNIIRYCNRPFADTQEMNEAIVERMNASVKPNDVLYFLGDFCMGGPKAVALYRNQIGCKTIHFIDGNHDNTTRKVQHLFTSWSSLSEIRVGKQGIVLCHYAMKVWPQHSRGRGSSMAIHTATFRMIRCRSRWTLEWIATTFGPGISMRFRPS
jgi:calcineurin-like phosphoesterase family protein